MIALEFLKEYIGVSWNEEEVGRHPIPFFISSTVSFILNKLY